MSQNLYFRSNELSSNKDMAYYFYGELLKEGIELQKPEDNDYMYSMKSIIEGEVVDFYMGKNDEDSNPSLWQAWPEQKIPFLQRVTGRSNRKPEEKAKILLEKVAGKIRGVTSIEWGI